MAKRKSSRARRKSKKGYSKLIALCAVAVVLVTAAVLLTVLPSRSPSPTQLAGTPSPHRRRSTDPFARYNRNSSSQPNAV